MNLLIKSFLIAKRSKHHNVNKYKFDPATKIPITVPLVLRDGVPERRRPDVPHSTELTVWHRSGKVLLGRNFARIKVLAQKRNHLQVCLRSTRRLIVNITQRPLYTRTGFQYIILHFWCICQQRVFFCIIQMVQLWHYWELASVWPEKNRQMPIKVAQNWFH